MKKISKWILCLTLVICIIIPTLFVSAATGFTAASDVNYVKAEGKYVVNWGDRDEDATFLSTNAQSFYKTGNTFEEVITLDGGSSISNAHKSELYTKLKKIMTDAHTYIISYDATRDLFKYTDCIKNNSTQISSFYSGDMFNGTWDSGKTWNREHTWPNSKGDLAGNGENDIMMLRPTLKSENGSRGNQAYGTTSDYYNPNAESGGKYDLRGDVSRIILYQYTRWGCINTGASQNPNNIFGIKGVIESLDVLLDWMEEDPVDTWEMGRNDAVQSITGTRNVFIDYPEYAWALFGEDCPDDLVTPSGNADLVPDASDRPDTPDEPEEPEVPENKDPVADSTLTVKEAIALGASKEHNVYTEGKYYVAGEITEVYNTQYGNMKVKDAEGNILTIYGTYSADGSTRYDALTTKPVAGDTVKIYGIVGQYNGTPQIKNGWIVEHKSSGTTPETPVDPKPEQPNTDAAATISFADLANRVSANANQQVWAQNGITVTNNKGSSTSDVNPQYYNPVRFYKNSDVTIAYPGMTKIEIDCTNIEAKNKNAWVNSCSDDNATATLNGNVVTITFASAVDSFKIQFTDNQARANSITVYTSKSGGTTPEEPEDPDTPVVPPVDPEDPEVPENKDPVADSTLTVKEAIALGASKEHNVYTEGKYYVAGEITEVYNTQYGNMKIKDAEGNILTIYGTYSADGSARYDAMDVKPVAGDTVKIYGIVGQYNGTPQIKNGWIVEHTPATQPEVPPVNPEDPDTPVVPPVDPEDPEVPAGPTLIDLPVVGTAYKFGFIQEQQGKVLYAAGGMSGFYMATTENVDSAVDVYLEEATGGYYLYTLVDGKKQYFNIETSADGNHVNAVFKDTPDMVFVYDAEKKTLVTATEVLKGGEGAIYAFGTYGSYATIGTSKADYADNYFCHFYTITAKPENPDTPVVPPVDPEDPENPEEPENPQEPDCENGLHIYSDDQDLFCNECGKYKITEPTLLKEDGVWYYYNNGVYTNETTLVKYNGKWFYIEEGAWNPEVTTLVKYSGKWFYIKNGKWDSSTEDLVKHSGKWFYIKSGKWNSSSKTLFKKNGSWFYINKGKWDSDAKCIFKYNGKDFFINKGKWNSSTNTLFKKDGKYYAIKSGKWTKSKTIIKYNGKKYYVNDGYAKTSYSGKITINGKKYTVKKGIIK